MSIFDDGQVDDAMLLSDESLERQSIEGDLPQETPNDVDIEPEANTATEDGGQEEAQPLDNPAPEGKAVDLEQELAQTQKNYDNLRSWSTKVSMENSQLKKQLEKVAAQLSSAPAKGRTEEENKVILQELLKDPEGFLQKRIQEGAEQRVQEVVAPLLEERRRALVNRQVGAAVEDLATGYSQLSTPENRRALAYKMFELAAMDGNPAAWQADPGKYGMMAARQLWGWPTQPAPSSADVIELAKQQIRKEEELNKQNKTGLTINSAANKQSTPSKLSPEEEVLAGIVGAKSPGMFM